MRYILLLLLLPTLAFSQSSEVLNPDVRQDTIQSTICVSGYTASVRPSSTYTNGIKRKLMREQGIDPSEISSLILDHKINLSIGGHPRNIHNLMLQTHSGSKKKDKLELRLQKMVCRRQITLAEARSCIWNDWVACSRTAVLRKRQYPF